LASHAQPTPAKSNKLYLVLGITSLAALAILGVLFGPRFFRSRDQGPRTSPILSNDSATTSVPAQSIAVLPLTNEGGAQDEQYFSDGLSEDLITALSQFAGLKVIGRKSSFQFRDSKDDSKTIGAKLGVAHLLEGSVRRAADAVRISAELVNAADGSTLWSQHYDRPYKDLFKLQDDITTAVATALKAKLLNAGDSAAQSDRPPSGNLAAYNAFLEGKFHFARDSEADYRKAIESYKAAIALDPRYARAYAALAFSETLLSDYSPATAKQNLVDARTAVDTALRLNPDLADAHNARGVLLLFTDIDVVGTEAEFKRALQLAPNDPNAKASLAQARAALGHPEAAIEPIRQAIAADPLSAGWYSLLTGDLMAVGRLEEAEAAVHDELALHSSNGALARLSGIETLRGNAAAAVAKAEQIPAGKPRDFALTNARQIGSDQAAADATLKTLIDRYAESDAYFISRTYALRKEPDKVFEWLDRAWASRDNNISILYYDPFLLPYKSDPRFAAFCRKVGLPTPADVAGGPKS
jgi:TolB-like protein/Tfp pilus assembly protein PilF